MRCSCGSVFLRDEVFDLGAVAVGEEEHAARRIAVAARAARLLIVAFEVARQVVVDHRAHVGLVDAHAEGDGGDQHRHLVADEARLIGRALLGGQPGVVGQRGDAVGGELPAEVFGAARGSGSR